MKSETSLPSEMYVECAIDGTTYRGRVVGVSQEEARAEFVTTTDPGLHVTQDVPIVFQSPGLRKPLPARAKVVQTAGGKGPSTYVFRLAEATTAAVRTLFNRRGALRLWCAPDQPMLLSVATPEASFMSRVRDLSMTGMGFAVNLCDEEQMRKQRTLRLTFTPHGSPRELEVLAHVRHCSLDDTSIVYGVEFDAQATPGFEDVAEEILGWVRRREVAIIRAARDAADRDS